jgi:hypothetical protein
MDRETLRDYELEIIVKAWRDESFRLRLLKDPKNAIEEEFQVSVPGDMEICVHEENENNMHLIVPKPPEDFCSDELSDDELRDVIGGAMATGHVSNFPASHDRIKLRSLQKENEQQKKMIDKLKDDLNELEQQLLK